MTEAMNIRTIKGKILFAAIVLAAFVAVMAASAKPAQAATCSSYAENPYYHKDIIGRQWVMFATKVQCSGAVDNISIDTNGFQYYGGGWHKVSDSGRQYLGRGSYFRVKTQVLCGAPYTNYGFKTQNYSPQVKENGIWRTLPTRMTTSISRTC